MFTNLVNELKPHPSEIVDLSNLSIKNWWLSIANYASLPEHVNGPIYSWFTHEKLSFLAIEIVDIYPNEKMA